MLVEALATPKRERDIGRKLTFTKNRRKKGKLDGPQPGGWKILFVI